MLFSCPPLFSSVAQTELLTRDIFNFAATFFRRRHYPYLASKRSHRNEIDALHHHLRSRSPVDAHPTGNRSDRKRLLRQRRRPGATHDQARAGPRRLWPTGESDWVRKLCNLHKFLYLNWVNPKCAFFITKRKNFCGVTLKCTFNFTIFVQYF